MHREEGNSPPDAYGCVRGDAPSHMCGSSPPHRPGANVMGHPAHGDSYTSRFLTQHLPEFCKSSGHLPESGKWATPAQSRSRLTSDTTDAVHTCRTPSHRACNHENFHRSRVLCVPPAYRVSIRAAVPSVHTYLDDMAVGIWNDLHHNLQQTGVHRPMSQSSMKLLECRAGATQGSFSSATAPGHRALHRRRSSPAETNSPRGRLRF